MSWLGGVLRFLNPAGIPPPETNVPFIPLPNRGVLLPCDVSAKKPICDGISRRSFLRSGAGWAPDAGIFRPRHAPQRRGSGTRPSSYIFLVVTAHQDMWESRRGGRPKSAAIQADRHQGPRHQIGEVFPRTSPPDGQVRLIRSVSAPRRQMLPVDERLGATRCRYAAAQHRRRGVAAARIVVRRSAVRRPGARLRCPRSDAGQAGFLARARRFKPDGPAWPTCNQGHDPRHLKIGRKLLTSFDGLLRDSDAPLGKMDLTERAFGCDSSKLLEPST